MPAITSLCGLPVVTRYEYELIVEERVRVSHVTKTKEAEEVILNLACVNNIFHCWSV